MPRSLRVGIIGCGDISSSYLQLASLFKGYRIIAVADIDAGRAAARASEFGVRAETVADLLEADDIDLVINLTIPAVHFEVSRSILQSGKHVYSEKPFVLNLAQAQELGHLAASKKLRIGSAPDTFLGASHQLARDLVDEQAVGTITSGIAVVMSHGMEDWHPNPDFFFQEGGGPVLDLGPYYISNLVQILGPVKRVSGFVDSATATRTIVNGPRFGETIPVETPTTIHAIMAFESGAIITFVASWDVWHNSHPAMELYGTEGTINVPDPNWFGGEVTVSGREGVISKKSWDHPFAVPNYEDVYADYRGAGLADMALAISEDRPHRCSSHFATHVVEVMTAILQSGETGQVMNMTTSCTRPQAMSADEARALLA